MSCTLLRPATQHGPISKGGNLARLVLIEDGPVPSRWVDELGLEAFGRIAGLLPGSPIGRAGLLSLHHFGFSQKRNWAQLRATFRRFVWATARTERRATCEALAMILPAFIQIVLLSVPPLLPTL